MKTYYLHTLDDKPGVFDGYQVCFATYYGKANELALSLRQIRSEQQASKRHRWENGWEDDFDYSHIRVCVPD